jgi:glucose-1-phosphate cytidylyltransferase
MKAVILAGGLGTRLSEETSLRPKPMVEIGGKPILWHIMKMYSSHGINDFVICCGYKGYVIKEYFQNYFLHMSDVTFNMRENRMEVHQKRVEPWNVTLVDTGDESMTGGRLLRVSRFVQDEEAFCFTYGDGVSDVARPRPSPPRCRLDASARSNCATTRCSASRKSRGVTAP